MKSAAFSIEEITQIEGWLVELVKDTGYKTEPVYSANTTLYPDNLMPFVEKHLGYLRAHPDINPYHYIANLRLMTRVR